MRVFTMILNFPPFSNIPDAQNRRRVLHSDVSFLPPFFIDSWAVFTFWVSWRVPAPQATSVYFFPRECISFHWVCITTRRVNPFPHSTLIYFSEASLALLAPSIAVKPDRTAWIKINSSHIYGISSHYAVFLFLNLHLFPGPGSSTQNLSTSF